jgi:hypothetical protein
MSGVRCRLARTGVAFTEMWIHPYDSVDTVIFGRRSFEGHLRVHSEEGRKLDDPKYLRESSHWLDRIQKICLSRSLKKTQWQNSRIMSGELGEVVAALRAEPGMDILLDGGPCIMRRS